MSARLESIEQNAYFKGEADGDKNHDEDGPRKLFVRQVTRTMSEEDIFSTFTGFGLIKELMINHDRYTGQHTGCAFVIFYHTADGLKAVGDLHDKGTLASGRKPLQVRPANESPSTTQPKQEN
jgi:RNA recognition motif-containing protein